MDNAKKHFDAEVKRYQTENDPRQLLNLANDDGRDRNNPLRKKLNKRAAEQRALTNGITPKSLVKTPSQKRSENERKKCNRRADKELMRR